MLQSLRRVSWLLAAVVVVFGLSACENTIRGIGEDAEDTGEAVEDAVE
jgi:predicted small secreted protein